MARAAILTLVEEGRLGEAIAQLESSKNSEVDSLVLCAFLSGLIGDIDDASELANRALSRHLTKVQRAYCLETKAKHCESLEAQRLLRQARDLMSDSHSPVEFARLLVRHGRAAMSLVSIEAAYAELPRTRATVLSCGDPQATIDLHLLSAEIEARQNKRTRSLGHLRTAGSLLQSYQNVFYWARLEQIRSNVAALSSDLEGALRAAHQCAKYARQAGWMAGIGSAYSNIALFRLSLGDVDSASESLRKGEPYLRGSKSVALPIKDTRLQVLLASGSPDALQYADELWNTEFTGDWRYSHCGLWHQLTRARLFLDAKILDEASEVVDTALPYAHKSGDGRLVASMALLAAEVLGAKGDRTSATTLLSDVYEACDELPLETFAELQRVSSTIVGTSGPTAELFAGRADRLFKSAGLENARKRIAPELGRFQRAANPTTRDVSLAIETLHSLSTMICVGASPDRIGTELIDLVSTLGVVKSATLVARGLDGIWRNQGDGTVLDTSATPGRLLSLNGRKVMSQAVWVEQNEDPGCNLAVSALSHLVNGVADLATARAQSREAAPLWPDETPEQQLGMVVAADNMLQLLNTTRRIAPSTVTVLFVGETGTGKELLARALHDASPRKDKLFQPFNCSSCAREMLDAQLFGYRRGAFTGAQEAFPGVIRAAAGGTLFLDEIGEITMDVQLKLLRFLESSEIHPLGEPRPIVVDVRVVAATNANLEQLVAEGKFREDLFYRLNVVPLEVPPLRKRREEIPLLVQHYLELCSRDMHKTGLRFAEETMEYLILYKWPGNVRQLANEVRRLVVFAESGAVLMPEHLAPDIAASRRTIPASERDLAPTEFVVRLDQPLPAAIEHVERTFIQYAVKLAGGMEEAAQLLGLSRKGLYLKRQRLGLDVSEPEAALTPVRSH